MADTFVGPVHENVTSALLGKGKLPLQTLMGKPSAGAPAGPGVAVAVAVGVTVGGVAVGLAILVDVLDGSLVGVSAKSAAAGWLPPGRSETTMATVANAASNPKNR
ncbi:MAG TPA: hypothetical protein VH951_13225 [Dehalococcoidia bacterium]|jgi:hypothetical protein